MARLDVDTYRRTVLKDVESCLLHCREDLPNFSSFNFYQALRSELTRADAETGLIDVPDDYVNAVDVAAARIINHMCEHHDLGFGRSH